MSVGREPRLIAPIDEFTSEFDKEVRRKPLAFAADAWSYGI